jgi:hypothetical protein
LNKKKIEKELLPPAHISIPPLFTHFSSLQWPTTTMKTTTHYSYCTHSSSKRANKKIKRKE